MAFEITGKVVELLPVVQVSDKFRKREFVIERKETGSSSAVFIDYIKFQLVQDKCELINESFLHDEIKISFNIKGNKWEKDGKVNYFTNLDAWRIERTSGTTSQQAAPGHKTMEEIPPENEELSDLPF